MAHSLGIDFGTNSVRAVIARCSDGLEVGTGVGWYPSGKMGVIVDERDPNVARQHPADYLSSMTAAVKDAIREAGEEVAKSIIGIGVDATGSTPAPMDKTGAPLALLPKHKDNPSAMFWLWKDHTGHDEAAEITRLAAAERPKYLTRCGGIYSAEWFWSKILHCARVDPATFAEAYTWGELSDWIPNVLIGVNDAHRIVRSRCAAGHKAFFNEEWGGLPDAEFLDKLDTRLGDMRRQGRLYDHTACAGEKAGVLCAEWSQRFGLREGIPVSVGIMDAHSGALGSGVAKGRFVKIVGTSTCDIAVWPRDSAGLEIPGICGMVDGSVIPGMLGLEAGQSAVGDIFNWYVKTMRPGGGATFEDLIKGATLSAPGQSGLLALDWWNGNRTVLVDQVLSGLLLGQTLSTSPAEIFRALLESTAFGALAIINRFVEKGVGIDDVVLCGGLAEKMPLIVQIYADVIGREMKIAKSSQTCALGAAIVGAVAGNGFKNCEEAIRVMAGLKETTYKPNPEAQKVYKELFELYMTLHDSFGRKDAPAQNLYHVMKKLIAIRDKQRNSN
eukprot:m51a1_g3017 putative l-ribulokinase (557) ;mRNA; f:860258-862133